MNNVDIREKHVKSNFVRRLHLYFTSKGGNGNDKLKDIT